MLKLVICLLRENHQSFPAANYFNVPLNYFYDRNLMRILKIIELSKALNLNVEFIPKIILV